MHSRLGHNGEHGHRCHGMEHGRLGGCNRDSFDSLALGGLAGLAGGGGGRPLLGSRNSLGDRYGWGREGRVRLDDYPMRPRRQGSMGGLGGLNIGRGGLLGGLGGGGGVLDGMDGLGGLGDRGSMRGRLSDGLDSGRTRLDGMFVHPEDAYQTARRGGGLGGRGRLGGGLFSPGGMDSGLGLGLGLGGEGIGVGRQAGISSAPPSLRGSTYSFDHLDRRSRPYHYQPPYVEDWESILEEELIGQDMMGMLDRRDGMMQQGGAELFGLPGGYDLEDMMGGGGLGGRRGRL